MEHECVFPEEQEPSGRLILAPCLECGYSALDAIKELQTRLSTLEKENKMLLNAVQMAYRKHHKDDPDIGWNELSDVLYGCLAEVMGDDEFVKWNEEDV